MAYPGTPMAFQQSIGADSKMASYRFENQQHHHSSANGVDPSVLNVDSMQSPASQISTYRKPSFPNSNGMVSPAESHEWDQQQQRRQSQFGDAQQLPLATQAFHDDMHGYVRSIDPTQSTFNIDQTQARQSQAPRESWSLDQSSGDRTPTASSANFIAAPPPHFESTSFPLHRTDSAHGQFSASTEQPMNQFSVAPVDLIAAPHDQGPMSPQTHQDWMGMAQRERDGRSMNKRMRHSSPTSTSFSLGRRDGIRKKNGRIPIPDERNLNTIDDLIDRETDEEVLKELKQQKRLLRNREAALASRQRKKKHTEDLECKEKDYTLRVSSLEQEIHEHLLDRQVREEKLANLERHVIESQQMVESLQEQIRDLNFQHSEETSSLRRKINVLTEQVDMRQTSDMSTVPSGVGFSDFSAEMEALNMGPHDWDSFMVAADVHNNPDDITFDTQPEHSQMSRVAGEDPKQKADAPTSINMSTDTSKELVNGSLDQPIASGLLFMLLLCGAFVASRPSDAFSNGLPLMPPDVRAAAPSVLSSLLSEDGGHSVVPQPQASGAYQPRSAASLPLAPPSVSYSQQNPRATDRLEQMHQRLTTPTKQQAIDQAFALTTAQYASIADTDLSAYNDRNNLIHNHNNPQPRRNLAEALANIQKEHAQTSKAEVFTRSLLWDQIPADVIRQFKAMVRDHDEIVTRQHDERLNDDDSFGYKLECL